MSPKDTATLKTCFDELAETDGDEECRAWVRKLLDAKDEIADFVTNRNGSGACATYVGFLKGSFNLAYHYSFSDGTPDAIIRFAKPGHTATFLRDEKVTNEVNMMEYLRQNTTIPIPRVWSWGLTSEGPQQLGPFIIMDYVHGTSLAAILRDPKRSEEEAPILNPEVGEAMIKTVYTQIANYMLQISQLEFSRIERPPTYNMNELASVTYYPVADFPTSPFDRASDYFRSLANEHLTHLHSQHNIAESATIAEDRFVARQRFAQLIPKYCIEDSGPFIPFCDDFRPSNTLVDPVTLKITAVLDFEYTNVLPAQFAYDPPWSLLISGPDVWLDRGAMDEFIALYEPRLEQFLQALERVEAESKFERQDDKRPSLSSRMRESWKTGRFWFDYGARKSFELDVVYWAALHDGGDAVELLDQESHSKLPSFVEMKMEQLKKYDEECAARFD